MQQTQIRSITPVVMENTNTGNNHHNDDNDSQCSASALRSTIPTQLVQAGFQSNERTVTANSNNLSDNRNTSIACAALGSNVVSTEEVKPVRMTTTRLVLTTLWAVVKVTICLVIALAAIALVVFVVMNSLPEIIVFGVVIFIIALVLAVGEYDDGKKEFGTSMDEWHKTKKRDQEAEERANRDYEKTIQIIDAGSDWEIEN